MKTITLSDLESLLERLRGRSYKAYKMLKQYVIDYKWFKARFTIIQGDPHAPPSVIEIVVPGSTHKLPSTFLKRENIIPLSDYLYRRLYKSLISVREKCGSGYSCYLGIPRPSPVIIPRSAVWIRGDEIIMRIHVGLPARGRKILARKCYELLTTKVSSALSFIKHLDNFIDDIREHLSLYHDHMYLKKYVRENNGLAFIADNSILPRESSLSDKPLVNAIPYTSPPELRVSIKLPSGRTITGSLIKRGLVVVTGGGYHGKTTLLESLAEAIYPHIRGDGREYVASLDKTIYVQAEDGRIVNCVDISSFIEKLPGNTPTTCFSSLDASGSTSMAASLSEAIELGVDAILIDEDTSATNLLYKDKFIAEIIPEEPIRTLAEQARSMISKTGIGFVIVSSASSAYIPLADTVIIMHNYKPLLYKKRSISPNYIIQETEFRNPRTRIFDGIRGLERVKSRGYKLVLRYHDGTVFELDTSINKRIVERGQVEYIGRAITYANKYLKGFETKRLAEEIDIVFEKRGFEAFGKPVPPTLSWISGLDVAWAINRVYNAVFRHAFH
ncbi:MAG: ABC-ATPase domain-containing protein [Thermoprotei archaeon]